MSPSIRLGRNPRPQAANVLPVTEYLRALEMFRDLPEDDLEKFGRTLAMRECAAGTVFFRPNDKSERLFILKSGEVSLYRIKSEGRRMVLARLSPVAIFGEMGLLGQTLHGSFAESVTPSLVCVATRDEVLELLRQHPDVALRLMEAVGTRLKAVEERLAGLALKPVSSRLAAILLSQLTPDNDEVGGFTHAELGEMVGALRQTVSETLAAMQANELIETGHKCITVKDRAGLQRLADQN